MTLEIISPSEVLFRGEADMVSLPGVLGKFTVLNNHASLISVLKEGNVRYSTKGNEEVIPVRGGIADIDDNKISVCVY